MAMKKHVLAAAAAALIGVSATSNAAITIGGVEIPVGSTFTTITLFEGERLGGTVSNGNGVIDQVGEELVGVGLVNQILDASNNIIWSNGDNGVQLSLVIKNYFAESITLASVPLPPSDTLNIANILFSGGAVELYTAAAGSFSANGTDQASVLAAVEAGTPWLSLVGSPLGGFGANTGDPITLSSTGTNTNGDPLQGVGTNVTGSGFLDVTGGPAGDVFDNNIYPCTGPAPCPDVADFKFTSSGQLNALGDGNLWGFRGTGEIETFSQVPLPGTLALLGVGLMGLGVATRRGQQVKQSS